VCHNSATNSPTLGNIVRLDNSDSRSRSSMRQVNNTRIGNNQPNNPLFYHWVLLQSKIRISDCWARMAATDTIWAGQCKLGLECQAPNKTHQAQHRCINCKHGLHALFCCEVTVVNDNQTYHCKHGYRCNKATAGVASHPLEC